MLCADGITNQHKTVNKHINHEWLHTPNTKTYFLLKLRKKLKDKVAQNNVHTLFLCCVLMDQHLISTRPDICTHNKQQKLNTSYQILVWNVCHKLNSFSLNSPGKLNQKGASRCSIWSCCVLTDQHLVSTRLSISTSTHFKNTSSCKH